jgi:hypothetical protein
MCICVGYTEARRNVQLQGFECTCQREIQTIEASLTTKQCESTFLSNATRYPTIALPCLKVPWIRPLVLLRT